MALSIRQTRCYRHTIDIWSATKTINATTGKPSDETYTLVKRNVPCRIVYTPNIDSETGAGRFKEFTMLVTDRLYCEANTPIRDNYISVNVSTFADGSHQNTWGDMHRMVGAPTIHDTAGFRKTNELMIEAMSLEHPPDTIRTYYGL